MGYTPVTAADAFCADLNSRISTRSPATIRSPSPVRPSRPEIVPSPSAIDRPRRRGEVGRLGPGQPPDLGVGQLPVEQAELVQLHGGGTHRGRVVVHFDPAAPQF